MLPLFHPATLPLDPPAATAFVLKSVVVLLPTDTIPWPKAAWEQKKTKDVHVVKKRFFI
jgi:hypothetical protein